MKTKEEIKEFRNKINKFFKALRKEGFAAEQNFACCQRCGHFEIQNYTKTKDKYCFYHEQDTPDIKTGSLYLSFATVKYAKQIVAVAKETGLKVEWNGKQEKRIRLEA